MVLVCLSTFSCVPALFMEAITITISHFQLCSSFCLWRPLQLLFLMPYVFCHAKLILNIRLHMPEADSCLLPSFDYVSTFACKAINRHYFSISCDLVFSRTCTKPCMQRWDAKEFIGNRTAKLETIKCGSWLYRLVVLGPVWNTGISHELCRNLTRINSIS
jgi:hypothetical protein